MIAIKPKRARGRRKPLTPEQQGMAERYVSLARSLAKPFKRRWPREWEELDSSAMFALVEAVESFDPSRGVPFATFARIRIVGALRDVCRRAVNANQGRDVAPCADMLAAEQIGRVLVRPAPSPGQEREADESFDRWMRRLPQRHADACRCVYARGLNQAETSRELQLSQTRISTILRESWAMLSGTFGRDSLKGTA
jgi:RNA polymerase sigma factor (sigma-70 family)